MRPYSRIGERGFSQEQLQELHESTPEDKVIFPFPRPSLSEADGALMELLTSEDMRMGDNLTQHSRLEKFREYSRTNEVHPQVAAVVMNRFNGAYSFFPLTELEFRQLVLRASQAEGVKLMSLFGKYVHTERAEDRVGRKKIDLNKDEGLLRSFARHLDYLIATHDPHLVLHSITHERAEILSPLVKYIKSETKFTLLRYLISSSDGLYNNYGYSRSPEAEARQATEIERIVGTLYSKKEINAKLKNRIQFYVTLTDAEVACLAEEPDELPEAHIRPYAVTKIHELFSGQYDGVLDGQYKEEDLARLLQLAYRAKIQRQPELWITLGVDQHTLTKAVALIFEKKLTGAIGDAVQFAWHYDFLDLKHIPVALAEAGFEYGQWLPSEIIDYARVVLAKGQDFNIKFLTARKRYFLSPLDAYNVSLIHPEILTDVDVDFQKIAHVLIENRVFDSNDVADELAYTQVSSQFSRGVQEFGAEIMLRYGNRVGLNPHDAYYFFDDVISLFHGSHGSDGLNKPKLGKKILLEVAADDAAYEEGAAQHRFATVIESLKYASLKQDLVQAKKYKQLSTLQDLVAAFEDGSVSPFDSWKLLKKWYDLHLMLGKSYLLDQLSTSKTSPRLREFVEKLAFHPNVAMDAVIMFWQKPDKFLDIDDQHATPEINAVKKPANYLSLPYLNLRGADLRDVIVEGELDELQVIPPMERTYTLTVNGEDVDSVEFLHRYLRSAIGQARKGIPGHAKDSQALFGRVQTWCRDNGFKFEEVFDEHGGVMILHSTEKGARTNLRQLIFDKTIGAELPQTDTYTIIIGRKSDPDMVVAGNDTASCMPFGSGKNNVYMFNPNCAQLVVQRLTGADTWRTSAQSVMTLDLQTSRPTPDMIREYAGRVHLKDLVSEDDLMRLPVLTADNIEIAKNDEGRRIKQIQAVYELFFTEYLRHHGLSMGVDMSRVVIGTGYTPAAFSFKRERNTYIPMAPMGYSDNVHEECLVLETGLINQDHKPRKGIEPLRATDSVAVAVLEGKAYHDNPTVVTNLHRMQNSIIGMEIANRHFDRPNLSFIYRDSSGAPKGYILAYEGQIGSYKEIYIDDLAVDVTVPGMGAKLAGGRLIEGFFRAYCRAYGSPEKPYMPIFMNAREQTSYQVIVKQLDKLAREANLVVQLDELDTDERGGDIFHNVRIFVGRSEVDIEAQKIAYSKRPQW